MQQVRMSRVSRIPTQERSTVLPHCEQEHFELAHLDILQLSRWFERLEADLSARQKKIGHEVIKEIRKRLKFLLDVGLDYLTLHRSARTLNGGESRNASDWLPRSDRNWSRCFTSSTNRYRPSSTRQYAVDTVTSGLA